MSDHVPPEPNESEMLHHSSERDAFVKGTPIPPHLASCTAAPSLQGNSGS